jgi:thymidylate synthase
MRMILSPIFRGAQRFVTRPALGEHRCFDDQYLHLLGYINAKGERSSATKGPHRQAPRESAITIDLAAKRADQGCGYFLPLTSLRSLDFKHVASEALWYLRGEDNIKFLRRHKNPFWDAVAGDDAGLFVGLNWAARSLPAGRWHGAYQPAGGESDSEAC